MPTSEEDLGRSGNLDYPFCAEATSFQPSLHYPPCDSCRHRFHDRTAHGICVVDSSGYLLRSGAHQARIQGDKGDLFGRRAGQGNAGRQC